MVRTAQELEAKFKMVGIARQGDPQFANDDGYWTGGRCNWGGSHNLSEDCQTLASGLNKAESLNGKAITDALTKCTSKQEFESNKSTLLRKADEVLSQLKLRTGASSSMFGVCCIWGQQANDKLVETELNLGRTEIINAKKLIENTNYNWAEEIKDLTAEIRNIEMGMEEKQKRALDPNLSPSEKMAILEDIENDGKLLQAKYQEKNELTGRFKHIDPSKHVSKLIERMKQAIEGSYNKSGGYSGNHGGGGLGGNGRNKNKDTFGGNGGGRGSGGDGNDDKDKTPRGKKDEKKEKDNSQMIFLAIAVIVIFFLMTNQPKPQREEDYEYYY